MSDEYRKLREAYDPAVRCAPPPDECSPVSGFEVSFAIPVYLSSDQQRALMFAVSDIVDAPWNEPLEGVHWLSGMGRKPQWSKSDAAFLGKPADPNAPDGGEPEFDDSVLYYETSAREFVSEKDRARKVKHRAEPRTSHDPGHIAVQVDCIEYHLRKDPSLWSRVESLYRELRRMLRVGKYTETQEAQPTEVMTNG